MKIRPGQVYSYEYFSKELLVYVLGPETPKDDPTEHLPLYVDDLSVRRPRKRMYGHGSGWDCVVLHGDNHWNYPAGMLGVWSIRVGAGWERVV